MWIEQAVFSSSKTKYGEGYHVIARSPGISNELAIELTRWSPSHAALQSRQQDADSLNFHPLTADCVAVSRTTYGTREFSGRGGLQVVTIALVVQTRQFAGYAFDAFRLARVARSLGYLRWKRSFPEQLGAIDLPTSDVSESITAGPAKAQAPSETSHDVQRVVQQIRHGRRVAVIGEGGGKIIESVVRNVGPELRRSCYFTTGLKLSSQRPYCVQVLPVMTPKIRRRLESCNTHILTMGGA